MATAHHKHKFMEGMPKAQAIKQFLELFLNKTRQDFNDKYPGAVRWLETYYQLRRHDPTFEVIAQAFAEKVQRLIKEKRTIEQKIGTGRAELKKRLQEIDDLKKELARKQGG